MPPDPARPRPPYRFIGTLALLGAALLTGGTVIHPAHADPGSPTAAFAEYAYAGRDVGGRSPAAAGRGRRPGSGGRAAGPCGRQDGRIGLGTGDRDLRHRRA